jgi:PAS domain S-box-containing protein
MRDAHIDITEKALVSQSHHSRISTDLISCTIGYSRSELEGLQLEVLLPERFHAVHVLHRERYAVAPRIRPMGAGLELFGRRKDGTEVPVDISLSPLMLNDTRMGECVLSVM